MANLFSEVISPKLNFSTHDLSFESLLTTRFGWLTPILCEEVVPNDKFQVSLSHVFRFSPMAAPLFSSITASFHYWFVPRRQVSGLWEPFITRAIDGKVLTAEEYEVIRTSDIGTLYSPKRLRYWDYKNDIFYLLDNFYSEAILALNNAGSSVSDLSQLLNYLSGVNAFSGDYSVAVDNFVNDSLRSSTFYTFNIINWLNAAMSDESLFDYLGYFSSYKNADSEDIYSTLPFSDIEVDFAAWKSYWKIWFDFYRDENIDLVIDTSLFPNEYEDIKNAGLDVGKVNLELLWKNWFTERSPKSKLHYSLFDDAGFSQQQFISFMYAISSYTHEAVPNMFKPAARSYKKDYYTAALPFLQKGEEVQLSLNATSLPIDFKIDNDNVIKNGEFGVRLNLQSGEEVEAATLTLGTESTTDGAATLSAQVATDRVPLINITELRAAEAFQEMLELMGRAGSRYYEYLVSHFGTAPSDLQLQRPKFLGGFTSAVSVSDVIQQTGYNDPNSPLGGFVSRLTMSGSGKVFENHFQEHGYIIGLMSIMPQAYYMQGIPRKFLRSSNWDYYDSKLENLSEQGIYDIELYATPLIHKENAVFVASTNSNNENMSTFGYQERWSEYKIHHNEIHGLFKTDFVDFHQARIFSKKPILNAQFIHTPVNDGLLRPFVGQEDTDSPIWCDLYHVIYANRPMSYHSTPKLN